ncbi:MaoC family dehydratase [Sulfitobacter aestuariivivens]|uniref:MaoC family dehydratase n=1 Tax=Sulfitobacter aestuariivivens TaxID=2766981 RepID=A0A927HFZ7_9RHOB|nr:MaoC family dehydratase [Sulfitobacter aestuariivivens]MBD3664973.1 MaoC family dehydratase [Sulfitobacter aestuariivivens]
MADLTFEKMTTMVGEKLGTSSWQTVTQEAVNEFANCTGDRQWIHIDVERAKKESPFGGPVAHGYLTLSMLSAMAMEIGVVPKGTAAALNYGLDKVRFLAPVPVGAKVRLQSTLKGFDRKDNGQYLMKSENTIEIEGADKPALIAESLAILVPGPDA